MKISKLFLSAVLALSCGEPTDSEYGSLDQPYVVLNSPGKQWGTTKTNPYLTCSTTDTFQNCTFARYKKVELARNPADWTTSQNTVLSNIAGSLDLESNFQGWDFSLVDSVTPPAANSVRMTIRSGSVPGNQIDLIDGYRSVAFLSSVALTEGQQSGFNAPKGNYFIHGGCTVNIDLADIALKTSDPNEQLLLLDHAVGSAALVCAGVGMGDVITDSWSQRQINLNLSLSVTTTSEKCRVQVGETSDQADVSVIPFAHCP